MRSYILYWSDNFWSLATPLTFDNPEAATDWINENVTYMNRGNYCIVELPNAPRLEPRPYIVSYEGEIHEAINRETNNVS